MLYPNIFCFKIFFGNMINNRGFKLKLIRGPYQTQKSIVKSEKNYLQIFILKIDIVNKDTMY